MRTLKPLEDNVLVEIAEPKSKTDGGIILPDTAKEETTEGTVVAVGPGRICETATAGRRPVNVKVGEVVMFGKFVGETFTFNNKKHRLLNERDITAVVVEG